MVEVLTNVQLPVVRRPGRSRNTSGRTTVEPKAELQVQGTVGGTVQHGRSGTGRVVHYPIGDVPRRTVDQIELGQLHVLGDGHSRPATVPAIQHIVRGVADCAKEEEKPMRTRYCGVRGETREDERTNEK